MSDLNDGASDSQTSPLKTFTTPFGVLIHDLKNTALSKAGNIGLVLGSFLNADQMKYFSGFLSYDFSKNPLQADIIEMENLISKS